MNDVPQENLVFVIVETFHIKAFHFHQEILGKKDSFLLSDSYSCTTPLFWKKDVRVRETVLNGVLDEMVQKFQLAKQEFQFCIITFDPSLADIQIKYSNKLYISAKKDYELVPYFASSYFNAFSLAYTSLNYYSLMCVDNQGSDYEVEWGSWGEIAKHIRRTGHKDLNMWLNNLIRPVMASESFFLSGIAGFMMQDAQLTLLTNEAEEYTFVAGGELFSWLHDPVDVLFPFLVGIVKPHSFMSIYHDNSNVLSMTRALKDVSLKLLEQTTGRFVTHVGEIISIKSKKKFNITSLIGRIVIKDNEGIRTLYPVPEDVMLVRLHGLAHVILDLHFPFYVDFGRREFKARDLLVIDTRTEDRQNSSSFSGWYDRIKKEV